MFQQLKAKPALHVIIEPHPDVLKHMKDSGWYAKPGVKILEGKWQDFVDSEELLAVGGFDVIYTDTFSEDYKGGVSCFLFLPTPNSFQICTNSGGMYLICSPDRSRASASSTDWVPPVRFLVCSLCVNSLISPMLRCLILRRLYPRFRTPPG